MRFSRSPQILTPESIAEWTATRQKRLDALSAVFAAVDPLEAYKATQKPEHLKYADSFFRSLTKQWTNFQQDSQGSAREIKAFCKACFYLDSGLAGAAMSSAPCRHCQRTIQWHTTAVPAYCASCAATHNVCCRCGATQDAFSQ